MEGKLKRKCSYFVDKGIYIYTYPAGWSILWTSYLISNETSFGEEIWPLLYELNVITKTVTGLSKVFNWS
jgi:hypothetical protein